MPATVSRRDGLFGYGWCTIVGFVCAMRGTKSCASHAPTSGAPSFSHEGMVPLPNSIGPAREIV